MQVDSNNTARFSGKTVLITGAAGEIGQATARRFGREGGQVLLVDRDSASLAQLAQHISPQAKAFIADVSDEVQSRAIFADAVRESGGVDMVVLNAGIEGRRAALSDLAAADFDRVMAVNVRGVFLWLSLSLQHMQARQGGVITITSSIGGLRGTQGMGAYVASKHAVVGLMKTAALEGAAHNIRVNALHPGPIDSRMMRSINEGAGDPDEMQRRAVQRIPLGRYGRAEEVASMTAFLSSDDARYCTGASYLVDGGIMAGSFG